MFVKTPLPVSYGILAGAFLIGFVRFLWYTQIQLFA